MIKKTIFTLAIAGISFHHSFGQHTINDALRKQLDSIYANDQMYRQAMVMQPGRERDSIAKELGISADDVTDHFGRLQNEIDSINLLKVELIFHKYGYPGKSLVGQPTNESAYYVIQHSGKIEKYFPLIEKAGQKGELAFPLVAMMQDRMLMGQGKEQVYGTQFAGVASQDSITGERKISWFLWPVKDYEHVSERRKNAGFKDTIEENAGDQGIELKVITLEFAKKNYPWLFPKKES